MESGTEAFEYAGVATRLPSQDVDRARGVKFEEYGFPGLKTIDGVAQVVGNYPSKGGKGELAALFRDSEGNIPAVGPSGGGGAAPGSVG